MAAVLSAIFVRVMLAVAVTPTGVAVAVMGGCVPSSHGVGVVIVAVLAIVPAAFLLRVPRIRRVARESAAISGNTVLPLHACQVVPLSRLNCGFSTAAGTVSLTVGVFAAEGPALDTVMV